VKQVYARYHLRPADWEVERHPRRGAVAERAHAAGHAARAELGDCAPGCRAA
jgi:hypothetical protein